MSVAASTTSEFDYSRLPIPAAVFEVLGYLIIVVAAALAFLAGWLSINGAVVLTVLLLGSLIILAWIHLGQGRHPVFLFLCTLMFFQGGRLLAYTLGADVGPMNIEMMQIGGPFSIGRSNAGIVLLCLCVSAICAYAPCRWKYLPSPPVNLEPACRYLPYLYLLFFATIPLQLYRNYAYYEWIQAHGGYFSIFQSHAELADSIPLLVRAIPLITFPVFLGIFVFERRCGLAWLIAGFYLASASLILIVGSRMAFFRLLLTLWFVDKVKYRRPTRLFAIAGSVLLLIVLADAVGQFRESPDQTFTYSLAPLHFIAVQGQSLDVTSMAVSYRDYFQPYVGQYLWNDLKNAFVSIDTAHYSRGRELAFDVPVLLNVQLFREGIGTGSSYIGEAYLLGGIAGVALFSFAVGVGLQYLYHLTRGALTLFVVALTLPEVIFMPRGTLLDWASALLRNLISLILLWFGWKAYNLVCNVRRGPLSDHFTVVGVVEQ
jgi:oligosaccharide repeat unit polymerase